MIRINWQDIYWIQAEGNYCSVVTIDKRFAVKTSLKKFLSKLPLPHFMQIHKAYIVNIRSIEKIDLKDSVVIIDGNYLPFGRIYRDTLLQQLEII
ncbi:MAG: LytR/AlgR family response regulator transcription factor [Saprospiraceae bacterium]